TDPSTATPRSILLVEWSASSVVVVAITSVAEQPVTKTSRILSERSRVIEGSAIAAAPQINAGASWPERRSGASRWLTASYGEPNHGEWGGAGCVWMYGAMPASGVARISQIQPVIARPARCQAEGALAA